MKLTGSYFNGHIKYIEDKAETLVSNTAEFK